MNQRITSRLAARLGLNIALDGALAALAVQAAYFLADPASPRPHPARRCRWLLPRRSG